MVIRLFSQIHNREIRRRLCEVQDPASDEGIFYLQLKSYGLKKEFAYMHILGNSEVEFDVCV